VNRPAQLFGGFLVLAGLAGLVWWWRTRGEVRAAVTTAGNPSPGMPDMETQPALNLPGISSVGQIGSTSIKQDTSLAVVDYLAEQLSGCWVWYHSANGNKAWRNTVTNEIAWSGSGVPEPAKQCTLQN
jgi:hypothetical protein